AQQDDVGRTRRGGRFGEGVHVEGDHVGQRIERELDALLFGIVVDVHEGGGVRYDPALLRQPRQVAQRLHRFEREDDVRRAARNEVRGDRVRRQTQVRLHVAAALAHAVDFGLLDVEPLGEGRFADYGGDGEDA